MERSRQYVCPKRTVTDARFGSKIGRGYMIARKLQIEPHLTISRGTQYATNDKGDTGAHGGDLVDMGSRGRHGAGGSPWRKGCRRAREVLRRGIWPEGD